VSTVITFVVAVVSVSGPLNDDFDIFNLFAILFFS
jgi:hypothetical protein